MLSAYMRFKYPNVIDAALAASAPIYMIAFTGSEREFFFPAVTQVILLTAESYSGCKLCSLFNVLFNMYMLTFNLSLIRCSHIFFVLFYLMQHLFCLISFQGFFKR